MGVPQQVRKVPHATVPRHRTRKGSRPMNATEIAAALSTRAEDVCRRYLPRGRRQGRYWTIGDTSGAKGRSLFVRLAPPGIPGKWIDAATNEHGDLLDLIRLHIGRASLRHAMEEASRSSHCRRPLPPMAAITPAATTVKKQRAASGGVADLSMAPMRKPICTPAPSAIAASRPCDFIPISSIATTMASTASRHWLPQLPATTAPSRGCSAPGSIARCPPRPISFARARRSGVSTAGPYASADPPPARPCLPAKASKPFFHWSPPSPVFMPLRLYRRAASAPSNRPKTSPCWSSPVIKTWKAGTPRAVFSVAVGNAAFPQS